MRYACDRGWVLTDRADRYTHDRAGAVQVSCRSRQTHWPKGHIANPAAWGSPQTMFFAQLPRPAIVFGLAGLVPQAIFLLLVVRGGPEGWFALAAACFYPAIILSFLGGMWWMTALLAAVRSGWIYALAVTPSLIGFAALLPWSAGWRWPHPSLVALGLALLASPLVDFYLNSHASLPTGWLRLRAVMASGLGVLTLVVAAV